MRKSILFILLITTSMTARNLNIKNYITGYSKYGKYIQEASLRHNIPRLLIAALISYEKAEWEPNADGIDGIGLMQVRRGPTNPKLNIYAGTAIFRYYF